MTEGLLLGNEKQSDDRPYRDNGKATGNSTFIRWGKFNLVGALGVVVQFAALFLLKSALHLPYLIATGLAVEVAVLHNFFCHERFTWADRILQSPIEHANSSEGMKLQLKWLSLAPGACRRLWRFHLANGAISVVGNLAIMRALVGMVGMNYLVANLFAIMVCSLANFMLSDRWVFEN